MAKGIASFTLYSPRVRPCFPDRLRRVFRLQVFCPRQVIISLTASNLPEGVAEIKRDVRVPVNLESVRSELNGLKLFEVGQRLQNGLLIITKVLPDSLVIEQNPHFKATPHNELLGTFPNLQARGTTLTRGAPDEAVRDLVEGDFDTVVRVLSQDHPTAVRPMLKDGTWLSLLESLDKDDLLKLVTTLLDGAIRVDRVLASDHLREIFHFLNPVAQQAIQERLLPTGALGTENFCAHLEERVAGLERAPRLAVRKLVAESKRGQRAVLTQARGALEALTRLDPTTVDETAIKQALAEVDKLGLLKNLEVSYHEDLARIISESRRAKLIEEIRKSNLLENVKVPLMHILAERDFVYVSMFSFTSSLFAAAIVATGLRGARVKVLLDPEEAKRPGAQHDNLVRYEAGEDFDVRTFSATSQHLKNIILGSGVVVMGSQNMSVRGFARNLEDLVVISGDRISWERKRDEFVTIFAQQGEYVALTASSPMLVRSGLTGFRFLGGAPAPGELDKILRPLPPLGAGNFRKLQSILALASGMQAEPVIDLLGVFRPFLVGIEDPIIANHLLPDFLKAVPVGFSFAPASSTGKYHPGTTTGISGLIEHEFIVLELAIKLCRILGREDLVDRAILAVIAHDAFKNARRDGEAITWGPYNPAHGSLASEVLAETVKTQEAGLRPLATSLVEDVRVGVAEHMSAFNSPVPTPLRPADPIMKFILVMADMIASRKYFYLRHRAAQTLSTDELMDMMLNNSFGIRGEALDYLTTDPKLAYFVAQCTKTAGERVTEYAEVSGRAKKMLRLAESLCDLFEIGDKEQKERRNDVLTATLLRGILRYHVGLDLGSAEAKTSYQTVMAKLRAAWPDNSTRQGRILGLMDRAEERLAVWDRAELVPADDPALWIVCLADRMMIDHETWIIIDNEVKRILSKAVIPRTQWFRRKLDQAGQPAQAKALAEMASQEYLSELLPDLLAGLLERLNFRRKEPLKSLHPEILQALIDKYQSLFPAYVYAQFYQPLTKHARGKMVDKFRAAEEDAEVRRQLVEEIRQRPAPTTPPPVWIYEKLAQTAQANKADNLQAKIIAPARDRECLKRYDYFPDIGRATERIAQAVHSEEKILVYGDYDVDGQAGTAILVDTLRQARAKALGQRGVERKAAVRLAQETIGYYIPHRLNEGYGLNQQALERIKRRGYQLVVTVDCGIREKRLIAKGKRMGLDFVVTDHHKPPRAEDNIDRTAVPVINPKLDLAADHPAYNLCGTAVAYKLALAIANKEKLTMGDNYLDLVALATVADVVSMTGENRALFRFGRERFTYSRRNPGLAAIVDAQHLERVDEEALAFFVAPLLNVLGRMANGSEGVELLLSRSDRFIRDRLGSMFTLLEQRREIEAAILAEAEAQLQNPQFFDPQTDSGIAVTGEWHKGVVGIVASRLVRTYGVPAVVISQGATQEFETVQEAAYGSMRCIKGVSPLKILNACDRAYRQEKGQPLFLSFGGHDVGAAGFKISRDKIADFQRIYREVCKQIVGSKREKIIITSDLREGEVTLEEVKLFKRLLGPFGADFEEPLFRVDAKVKSWQVFGRDYQHLRGYLENGTEFVIFNGNQRWIKRVLYESEGRVKMVAKLSVSSYKGKEKVVLVVEDIKS